MNIQQAVDFAFNQIKEVKMNMILQGVDSPEMIFAACKKLSAILNLPFDMVVDAFEVA
jgi:hypothetical protein